MLTQERLKEVMDYNPETGIFYWKVSTAHRIKIGDQAGTAGKDYIKIKLDGKIYQAHRLVWLYVYGEFPTNYIEHINSIGYDNRLVNLRNIPRVCGAKKEELTQELLKELLLYEPDTGIFYRNKSANRRFKTGEKLGHTESNGYIRITVGSSRYLAHRLAWFYTYGEWPKNHIDHINGVRTDNRISNLRDVDQSVNNQNLHKSSRRNKLGVLGVSAKGTRFRAMIKVNGSTKCLGTYGTAEDAHEAYLEAKRKYHPGNTL